MNDTLNESSGELKAITEPGFFRRVWDDLSAIDLAGYTKILKHANNATYLPWSNCWTLIMQRYPDSTFVFESPVIMNNNSVEIWCSLTISDGEWSATREMWLPVMDGKNNAIFDPSSRAISDARMRCLVKCASLFGLGIHLYSGEELAKLEAAPHVAPLKKISLDQATTLIDMLKAANRPADKMCAYFGITDIELLPLNKYDEAVKILTPKVAK